MAQWNDQPAVHQSLPLAHFAIADGHMVEFEKVQENVGDPWRYRVTVGNLFGSDGKIFDSLEQGLQALHKGLHRKVRKQS